MKSRTSRRLRPSFERLEDRWTPAGNVTAVFTAATATLTLTGDALANGVDVSAGAGGLGSFGVTGVVDGTATTVNNSAATLTFNGVKNLVINLNGGNDSLQFGITTAGTIIVQGNLTINTGTGNDTILTAGAGVPLDVFGALSITNGAGNATTILTDVNVVGAVTINHSAGGNEFFAVTASTTTYNSFGSFTYTGGTGFDFIDVVDTNVNGNVTVNCGAGTVLGQGAFVTFFPNNFSTNAQTIKGNLSITNTSGTFFDTVDDTNVNGNVNISAGNGGNDTIQFQAEPLITTITPVVKGNVTMTCTGNTPTVNVGHNTLFTDVSFVIQGGLTISLGSSSGQDSVTLNDLASVGNSSLTGGISITTGSGTDIVQIDTVGNGSTFNGNLTINTGAGNDTVRMNGAGASPTFFFGTVNVNQGAGSDSLELGLTGPINFFKAAKFVGGATGDVNNTINEVFLNTAGGPVVPTLVNYHP
jgi:hypothetical protein